MGRRFLIAVAGVALLAVAGTGCGRQTAPPAAGPAWQGGPGVWVVNRDRVTPVSLPVGRAARAVRVADPGGSIAIAGGNVYIPAGDHAVIPVSTANGRAGKPIWAGNLPAQMAVSPDGKTLWVPASNTVVPIGTATGRAGKPIVVDPNPQGGPEALAVTPDGRTVYADNITGTVVPVDTGTGRAGPPIRTGAQESGIAVTPDGKTVYVLDGVNTVLPISTATSTAGKPITIGPQQAELGALVITPDSRTVYVADSASGTVVPISTATNKAGRPIRVGASATFLAVTPDGRTVYAVTGDAVVPVSTATKMAGPPVRVPGFTPIAVVISPDGATAWVSGDRFPHRGLQTGPGFVLPIRIATNTPGKLISTGGADAGCLIAAPWRSGGAQGPAACNP